MHLMPGTHVKCGGITLDVDVDAVMSHMWSSDRQKLEMLSRRQ